MVALVAVGGVVDGELALARADDGEGEAVGAGRAEVGVEVVAAVGVDVGDVGGRARVARRLGDVLVPGGLVGKRRSAGRERGRRVGEDLAGAEARVGAEGLGGGGGERCEHGRAGEYEGRLARSLSFPRPGGENPGFVTGAGVPRARSACRPRAPRRRACRSWPGGSPAGRRRGARSQSRRSRRRRRRARRSRRRHGRCAPVAEAAADLGRRRAMLRGLAIAATVARLAWGAGCAWTSVPPCWRSSTCPGRARTGSSTPAVPCTCTR